MRNKSLYVLSLALLGSLSLFGQHNEQVTIEGTYRPQVNKVNKLLLKPELPEPTFTMPGTEVHPMEIEQNFAIDLEKITPLALNTKDGLGQAQVTENFLMAGIGTRLSPMFFYQHHSKLTKELALGVGINHYSSWLNMKDYGPSGFMNNAFDVSLSSSHFKNVQLGGKVYYKNDLYHFYGFHPTVADVSTLADATRQTYNTIGMHVGVASATTRLGELSHSGDLDYHYLFDHFDGREHYIGLNYELGYKQSWWGNKSNPQRVGVRFGLQYANFQGYLYNRTANLALNHLNRLHFQLNPYFEMKEEFYRLHLGVKTDLVELAPRFGVYPDIQGSLFVLNKKVEFYAGLNGGKELVTFRDLIEENPFLGRDVSRIVYPTVKLGFEAGVRTNVMETVDIHLGMRYRFTENDLFFLPDNSTDASNPLAGQPAFMLFADETVLVSILSNVRWLALDKMTVDAGFAYNLCGIDHLAHPLYRPTAEGNLKLRYDFDENLSLNASFLYLGGRYGTQNAKLKDVFDFGLGADYKIHDQLTLFAKLDNVANQKYQVYYEYPVTGIQFFAGVKMRF